MGLFSKATKDADQHLVNASAAHLSKIESGKDNAGRVVERHLDRIRDREIGLSDFVRSTASGLTKDAADKG
jgi:hypothetical protein